MQQRDSLILEKIIDFCNRIEEYVNRNNHDYDLFCSDKMFQDACLMCVIEIGELSVILSDDAKKMSPQIPWRIIKDTRNKYVHKYGTIELAMVWATINKDLPVLKSECEKLLDCINKE